MVLYRMELLEGEAIKEFVPCIPKSILYGEDEETKRICLSNSLDGCLTSAPWGGVQFEDLSINTIFRVYEFDTNDIQEGNLIYPEELYRKDLVVDAEITGEHWVVNQSLKPTKVYYIKIDSYHEEGECLLSYEDSLKADDEDFDVEDNIQGSIVSISILKSQIIEEEELLFGSELIIDLTSLLKEREDSCQLEEFLDVLEEFVSVDNEIENSYFTNGELHVYLEKAEGLWVKEYIKTISNDIVSVDKFCA